MWVSKKQRAECAVYSVAYRLLRTYEFFRVLTRIHYSAPPDPILLNQLVWLNVFLMNVLLRSNSTAVVINAEFVALSISVEDRASVDLNATSRAV